VLSGIAVQHADNGYYRHGNSGDSLVCNMFVIYLTNGTNLYGSRSGDFEGTESV